jgi:hypothetical protein
VALFDGVVLTWRGRDVEVDGFELVANPGVSYPIYPEMWE